MELAINLDNHHRYMPSSIFKLFVVLSLATFDACHAQMKSDTELLKIAHHAFDKWRSANSAENRIKVMREEMAGLSDAERTRAIALRIFDLDAADFGLKRYNTPGSAERVLKEDPSLINDPGELKRLLSDETEVRRFYVLATMANQLISSHNSDFVVEMAPMLLRSEPLASMPGEYQVESLTNASWFTYAIMVKNLKALNAGFVPPDDKLPYTDKVPALVEWLKNNWPGCESLGERNKPSGGTTSVRQEKRSHTTPANQPSTENPSFNTLWWKALGGIVILMALVFWTRSRSSTSSRS
jgi:hypothetical protein